MSRCYDNNLIGGFRTTFPVYFLDQVCSHDCMSMDVEESHDETEAAVPVLLFLAQNVDIQRSQAWDRVLWLFMDSVGCK